MSKVFFQYLENNNAELFTIVFLPQDGVKYPTVIIRSPYVDAFQNLSEEEIAFLRDLTDSFVLQEYKSFFFIDKNSSKKEAIEFYDNFEGENKEDEIGSSAGILMGIKASDFIDMLQEIKK